MSSSYINHFLQPDSIIPDWTNPQALNRYSYVTNRPVNFNDPTGHRPCGDGEAWSCDGRRQDPDIDPHKPIKDKSIDDPDNGRNTETAQIDSSGVDLSISAGIDVVDACYTIFDPGMFLGGRCHGSGGFVTFNDNNIYTDGECANSGNVTKCMFGGGSVSVNYIASYDILSYENMLVVVLHESYWMPPKALPLMDSPTFGNSTLVSLLENGQTVRTFLGDFTPGNIATPMDLASRDTQINYKGKGNFPNALIIEIFFGSDANGTNLVNYGLPKP